MEYDSAKKGAFSNAFKKTSAMLGVGNKTYLGLLDEDMVEAEQSKEEVERKLNGIKAIKELCKQKNIDVSECGDLENMSLEEITQVYKKVYNTKPEPKKEKTNAPSKTEMIATIAEACRKKISFGTEVTKELQLSGISLTEDLPEERLNLLYQEARKIVM